MPRRGKAKSNKNVEDQTFICNTCSRACSTRKSLRRHEMRNHRGTTFQCYHCDFTSKFKECLARHAPLHLVKDTVIRSQGVYVKCPLCDFGCVVRETMIKHYVDEHDTDISEQKIEFPNMGEFMKWKYYLEQSDICQFTSRSKKNRATVEIRYYRCFRDGIFQKKGKGIRNMKLKGSLKINGICPAGIKAERDKTSGVIRVTCVRSHVGHSNELGLLNLSKNERAEIAQKLAMGMTHEDIIGSIRGSMDANIKRVHLTTRKDLWNVQSSYGLGKDRKKYVKNSPSIEKCKKDDQTHDQVRPEYVPFSESLITETSKKVENVFYLNAPNEIVTVIENRQSEHCPNTSGINAMHEWNIQCRTEPQESDSFYSAQSVPEKNDITHGVIELGIAENVLMQHESADTEACDSSNDGDHYFEMATPDLPDSGNVPSETLLDEAKVKIRSKVGDLLDLVKTCEQAEMLYNELLRVQNTIIDSSLSRQFRASP